MTHNLPSRFSHPEQRCGITPRIDTHGVAVLIAEEHSCHREVARLVINLTATPVPQRVRPVVLDSGFGKSILVTPLDLPVLKKALPLVFKDEPFSSQEKQFLESLKRLGE